MQDEHLLRVWNEGHTRFSADLDEAFAKLRLRRRRDRPHYSFIEKAYQERISTASPERAQARSGAANAALSGVAACIATTVMLVSVAFLTFANPALGAQPYADEAASVPTQTILA